MAFTIVLHLDPTRVSHAAEVLQAATDHITVSEAAGKLRIEPDHAYVIAPNSKLGFIDGHIEVSPLEKDESRGRLIDFLFASLAESEGPRSVGITFSGSGQDGTEGVMQIREAGGLNLAQDPATSGYPSMPQSVIDAGVVDAVLAPSAMPAVLIEFARSGRRPETGKSEFPSEGENGDVTASPGFVRVLAELGEAADVNFDDYKTATIERRARRRMDARGIGDWEDYANHLASDKQELDALLADVLIGVTEFFRDAPVWDQLGKELTALQERSEQPGMRAWVPGCGTGEEAYTLAILLHALLPGPARSRVQIYATDLNERAIAVARRGLYAPEALEHLAPAWRERYFHQRDGQLQIDRSVRDCVTFAVQNVLADPPFSKMNVVSCRNLLIYLRPRAHDKLLKRLHFALLPGNLLVLGRAETPGRSASLFEEVSKSLSIYRARSVPIQERLRLHPRVRERKRAASSVSGAPAPWAGARGPTTDRRIEQFVLRERMPASVVLNSDLEIRHFYGRTGDYLVPPTGESRNDLLSWIRPGFYTRLRSVLKEVAESATTLSAEGHMEGDGGTRRVRCTVEPLPSSVGDDGLLLVSFHDLGESAQKRTSVAGPGEPLVRELERELSDARRELQAAIEHLESAGEEHHASNEEQQSLNEELQSSNEELEASKEELEALNEEMSTINRELEEKNAELREANADLGNLFLSTGIPTVFLDRNLCVRRFTSAAQDLFRIVGSDLGRSIEHVKERFGEGRTSTSCREVLESLEPHTSEVCTDVGRSYRRNILPYRVDDEVAGVCMTFMDVTEQNRALRESEMARRYSDAVFCTVRTPVLVLDDKLRVLSLNDAFAMDFASDAELIGRRLDEFRDKSWDVAQLEGLVEKLLNEDGDVKDFEVEFGRRSILINARAAPCEDDSSRFVLSFEDVTEQRAGREHAEQRASELRADAARKDEWIAMLGHELRNPIGAVSNAVTLLKSASLATESQERLVALVERQIGHVAGLLDDLLDAARIISGKIDIKCELITLAAVAEQAIEAVRPQIDARHHELVVKLPEEDVYVYGDPLRLTEVVTNLLTNAAKYTEPSGTITLAVSATANWTTMIVRDTGIGIPDDVFKGQMFDIFTQGPRSLDRGERGLGLGLPLVRRFVELHGGTVEVESPGTDRGSEFRVTLPRAQLGADRPQGERRTGAPAPPRRVLIVDDERDAASTLEQVLREEGHQTRTAADGPSALAFAIDFRPDVGLLDLGLPGMDGYELARRLRKEFPEMVLVAVTGYREDPGRQEAAGIDHHLIKPLDMVRLRQVLGIRCRKG